MIYSLGKIIRWCLYCLCYSSMGLPKEYTSTTADHVRSIALGRYGKLVLQYLVHWHLGSYLMPWRCNTELRR
uniref:Uncharacterized protein n=1 Tax=Pararge aegeria TaxID=116150 RepID=S4NLC5_9NEOP